MMAGRYFFNQEDGTISLTASRSDSIPLTQFIKMDVPETRLDELCNRPDWFQAHRETLYDYLFGEMIYHLFIKPEGDQEELFTLLDLILLVLGETLSIIEKDAKRVFSRHVQREINSFIQKRLDSLARRS